MTAVPVATGSPAGFSFSPASVIRKTRSGERSVFALAITIADTAASAAMASTTAKRLISPPFLDGVGNYDVLGDADSGRGLQDSAGGVECSVFARQQDDTAH